MKMRTPEVFFAKKAEGFASKRSLLEGIMRGSGSEADRMEQLIERLCRSNVTIETKDSIGSGVILSSGKQDVVITARHVVEEAMKKRKRKNLEIRNDGDAAKALRVLAAPHGIDLAFLELDRRIGPPAAMSIAKPRAGALVIVIGAGLGIENTVSMGIVSKVMMEKGRKGFEYAVLHTDAVVNPGNSGGGMFRAGNGELIAVTSYKLMNSKSQMAEGGFAISVGNLPFLPAENWKAYILK